MAGVTTELGKNLILKLVYQQADVRRGTSLELGLFTNASGLSDASLLADIDEPIGGGYLRLPLTDASWAIPANQATYATRTFTAVGSDYSLPIYGAFIATTGTGPILLQFAASGSSQIVLDGQSIEVNLSDITD